MLIFKFVAFLLYRYQYKVLADIIGIDATQVKNSGQNETDNWYAI